jgi:Polyphosphate kinase 2 (PPK2)
LLVDSGIRLVKLFLHITPDEQLRRFRDRLIDPLKRWKLTYEDFRNRDRRSDYETAIEDMMEETSTKHTPWHLVPANSKPYGRCGRRRLGMRRQQSGYRTERGGGTVGPPWRVYLSSLSCLTDIFALRDPSPIRGKADAMAVV